MRVTLDIADDVLRAAEDIAKREAKCVGQVLSELARKSLQVSASRLELEAVEEFLGFRPLPARGVVVTSELINSLLAEDHF